VLADPAGWWSIRHLPAWPQTWTGLDERCSEPVFLNDPNVTPVGESGPAIKARWGLFGASTPGADTGGSSAWVDSVGLPARVAETRSQALVGCG
jgi:hypothetical protein